jgi:hypothetical protein
MDSLARIRVSSQYQIIQAQLQQDNTNLMPPLRDDLLWWAQG